MNKENSPQKRSELNQTIKQMVAEGGEGFLQYLKNLGLDTRSNLLVLSPSQHYYYDESDLRDLRTLVNLKKLNLVRHLDQFLHNLYRILPPDAVFIGCFSDADIQKNKVSGHDEPAGILDTFLIFLNSVAGHKMTRHIVSETLKTHGFKVMDMTEINGITYFYSRNVRRTSERKAC